MAGRTSAPGATVTSRVLALIGAFDEEHRRLTLTELAGRAGLPVPTAHRLLRELEEWGAVTREPTGEFVVGRRLWDVGLLAPVQTHLQEAAAPFLSDVHAATHATVHLAVRDGLQALYVDRLTGTASVPIVSTIGSRLPLYSTGVGKVLLAHASRDVRSAVYESLERVTAYTVTMPGLLDRQLERVVREGYATTQEEMTLGAASVAVPIFGPGGEVVAALGIVVPDLRRDRARYVAALGVAARGIARRISEVDRFSPNGNFAR